jgi:hypothetical protein
MFTGASLPVYYTTKSGQKTDFGCRRKSGELSFVKIKDRVWEDEEVRTRR